MGVYGEYCHRWMMASVVGAAILLAVFVAAVPALADPIPDYLASSRSHDASAMISSDPVSSNSSPADPSFFSISASPTGDVTLNCGGIPVEINYTDLAPHDEIREQSQRISRQLDPLINGFSVKVNFLF